MNVVIINLPHRLDRQDESIKELSAVGLDSSKYHFFSAKSTPKDGAVGCSLSHALALSEWLFSSEDEYCLVLEDDFHIKDKTTFLSTIGMMIECAKIWDVYLLASNVAIPTHATSLPNVFRVINAQTASAYLVSRAYAPTLIKLFFESAELLAKAYEIPTMNSSTRRHFYALDSMWKNLQINDVFMASLPALCIQRPSFSDIEMKSVDYRA